MIKILDNKQIKALDAFTIANEPVASIDLMERASRAFVNWFVQHFDATNKVGIVCGTGNNGGDGLAVARLLKDWGYPVKVWIVRGLVPESEDFTANLDRIRGKLEVEEIISESDSGLFHDRDVLIDAIFGSGLSRPVEGIYAQAIACINDTDAVRIAIDVPSGLQTGEHSTGTIIKADFTVCFQLPKLAFLLPQSHQYTGEWCTVDIGLSREFIRSAETDYFLTTLKDAQKIIRPRSKFDHKGKYGHALLIAGSYGKMGACVLATRASLRTGVGLLSVHVPGCGYEIIQTVAPEAMVEVDTDAHIFSKGPALEKYAAIGIGPGLGQDARTVSGLRALLEQVKTPMIIDADALNILSSHRELMLLIPENSVLTPHPKEFERMVGDWSNDFERLQKQKELAARLKSVVVVKGAYSAIATPQGKVYFNGTGNPGMAKGGSGDVLTGILTGFLAQGYSAEQTAILGLFLHGLAADIGVQAMGTDAFIPSDLIKYIPNAFQRIGHK